MNEMEKKLLSVIDLNKLSVVLVEDVILASLKKVVDDSTNAFDDAAYAMLAPLVKVEAEKYLAGLIAKI